MESKFSLFDTDANSPIIPSLDQGLNEGTVSDEDIKQQLKSGTELISEGLDRAIRGETVKSMMIPEDTSIALPNYVIDITSVERFADYHTEALDALLDDDGDVIVYIYTPTGLVKVGRGLSFVLDRIIAPAINNLFSSKGKVYKDFQIGKPVREISGKNLSTLRLNI